MPKLVSNHLNPSDFPRCLRGKYSDGKGESEGVVRKLGSPREGRRGESERVQISVNPRQHCISIHILGKGGKTPERDMVGDRGMKSLTTSKQGTEAPERATQACSWQDMMH